MAIRISELEELSKQIETKDYVYKDLFLDLQKQSKYNPFVEKNITQNDLQASYDLDAIINSLRNLFTTTPGQRFLFPKYGIDLRRYLFQPINRTTSNQIAQTIGSGIKLYEPRVVLRELLVEEDPDQNLYNITVVIEIPMFKTTSTINSVLDVKTEKFIYIKVK